MKLIYRIYQLFVVLPFLIFSSIACALVTTIGCTLGDGHYWGYYPGKWWGRFIIWVSLLPIKVEGREHLRKDQSYVFVSNHQGSFDIFIIYGFLGRNFKWMMKQGLRKIPFVGKACEGARSFTGHMGVFRRGAFMLADELQLPVCPLTINGAFDVMPRMRDWRWLTWHRLSLTIHEPIYPTTQGPENVKTTMDEAYKRVMSGLVKEYQGFVENPDQ
mgnify:CR=1 FL=1